MSQPELRLPTTLTLHDEGTHVKYTKTFQVRLCEGDHDSACEALTNSKDQVFFRRGDPKLGISGQGSKVMAIAWSPLLLKLQCLSVLNNAHCHKSVNGKDNSSDPSLPACNAAVYVCTRGHTHTSKSIHIYVAT